MPTHEESAAFLRDFRQLTDSQRARFGRALRRFVADLRAMEAGQKTWFRPGLRVKPVRGAPDLFEMSWAPNGRATFSWGDPIIAGTRHVLWHRCGSHDILP